MIRQAYNYLATIPAVFIDGSIYVMLAVSGAWGVILTSDATKTYIGPVALFWITAFNATINSALLALKMFRSTAYADHQQDKNSTTPTAPTSTNQNTNQDKTNEKTTF